MSRLDTTARIVDSYIPASHDASSYPMVTSIVIGAGGGAIAQSGNYSDQLKAGSRYFDVRCQWHDPFYVGKKDVYLHHSKANFDTFETVLRDQIAPFAKAHDEIIFLDIDFTEDDGLGAAILALIEKYVPTELIATEHLNPDGTFNNAVTWGDLKGRKFVILWTSDDRRGRPWLANSLAVRWSPYGNFNGKSIDEILAYLDSCELGWDKTQIYIAQDIDTPNFSPVQQPAILDNLNHGKLNGWIEKHQPGANINVVFRDFVGKDYNKQAFAYLIGMNAAPQVRALCADLPQNRDGRLQAIYTRAGALYSRSQQAPNGAWGAEQPLGGLARRACLATNADGRLEVFYVGTDQRLYHNWQSTPGGPWSGEQLLVGVSARSVCAARNLDGRLEVFYVGTDSRLYHLWQVGPNGTWSAVSGPLGAQAVKSTVVGTNADGRLELLYVGVDGTLYHTSQATPGGGFPGGPSWANEQALGGTARSAAVGLNQDGRLEVFYIGKDHKLYHNWQVAPGGTWNGEYPLGGQAQSLTVATNVGKNLEVFYIGTDGRLYHRWQLGGGRWSDESCMSGAARSLGDGVPSLSVGRTPAGLLQVAYIGKDGTLKANTMLPGWTWSGEHAF